MTGSPDRPLGDHRLHRLADELDGSLNLGASISGKPDALAQVLEHLDAIAGIVRNLSVISSIHSSSSSSVGRLGAAEAGGIPCALNDAVPPAAFPQEAAR